MNRYPSSTSCSTAATKTVYSEIEWGLKFRKKAKKERETALKNCDSNQKTKKSKPTNPCAKMDELFSTLNVDGRKIYADPFTIIRKEVKRAHKASKEKAKKKKKTKIIDRNTLTHRQHIELLAKPRTIPQDADMEKKKPEKRTRRKKCCAKNESYLSPRMKQLAMPTKRLVFATWSNYKDILDPNSVERMENILHAGTGHDLEPKEAIQYFKNEERRKKKPKMSKSEKKKQQEERDWLTNEVNILADLIVHDIAANTLPPENNCHMQLTATLIATLKYKGYKIKPINRNTKSFKKRTILEILDHISVWSNKIFLEAEMLEMKLNAKRYEAMLASYKAAQLAAAEKSQKQKEAAAARRKKRSGLYVLNRLMYEKDGDLVETFIRMLEGGNDKTLKMPIHIKSLSDSTYAELLKKLRSLRDPHLDEEDLNKLQLRSPKHEMQRWSKKRSERLGVEVTQVVELIFECLMEFFKPPPKERSSQEKGLKQSSKADRLRKSDEILRTMSENVDLSDVPVYKDPNEFMEEDFMGRDATDDEEDYFDRSMFAGIQDAEEDG